MSALVGAYRDLLSAVSPKLDEEAGEDEGEGERHERIWQAFWSTPGKRAAQAAKAKAAARTFVRALSGVIPAEAMGSVYIHYLTCHIEEQIKEFGPLWWWSGEGLEHKNFIYKKTGRAMAQRGLAGHQNGGAQPKDGTAQKRSAPGREGQTVTWVVAGEKYGGVARQGHTVKKRHALPASIL